jgi:hypothetical protein
MTGRSHIAALAVDNTSTPSPKQPPPDPIHPSASAASPSTPLVSRFRSPLQLSDRPPATTRTGYQDDCTTTSPPHLNHHPPPRRPSPSPSRRWARYSDDTLVSSPTRTLSPSSLFTTSQSGHNPMTSKHDSTAYYGQGSNETLPTFQYPPPLIARVTNEWQNNEEFRDSSFESQDSYSHFMSEKDSFRPPGLPAWTRQINIPRRAQRYLFVYTFLLVGGWFTWLYYLRPTWEYEHKLDSSLAAATKSGSSFGVNVRPSFTDMIQVKTLDPSFIPAAPESEDKRLIFIGDVHGCTEERTLGRHVCSIIC